MLLAPRHLEQAAHTLDLIMATLHKILLKVLRGTSDRGIRFDDLRRLLTALLFVERIKGSHHIFHREGVEEIINLQPRDGGLAKPYQVRQIRNIITKYELRLPGEEDT